MWARRAFAAVVAVAVFGGSAGSASAHANLTKPVPRDTIAHKTGPCGVPRGNNPTSYGIGETIQIDWDETIDHTGCFVVELSSTGDDGIFAPLNVTPDPANAAPKSYTASVTLPAGLSCTTCTLRLRQLMGADPATCNGTTTPTDGTYYSCADVVIGGTGSSPLTPDAGAGPGTPGWDASALGDLDGGGDAGLRAPASPYQPYTGGFADTGGCNIGASAGEGVASLAALVLAIAITRRRRRR